MEFRTLRYFVAVAEELHFRHAAERVQIAQPALSQQIRKLEDQLGVKLFSRTKRSVALTPSGEFFLQAARSIIRQTDAAVAGVRAGREGVIGHLDIGLINAVDFRGQVFSVLREFRARCPGVAVTLKVMTSVEQIRALHRGEIQVGFVRLPIRDRSVVLETMLKEELLVALPPGHRLAKRNAIRLAELANDPFVMLPRQAGFGLSDQCWRLCKQAGFSPTISQDASELQTMTGLVAAGFGVSLVPASGCMLPRRGVLYKPLRPTQTVEIAAAYSKGAISPPLRVFLDMLHKAVHGY